MKKFQILVMALLFFLNIENSAWADEFGELEENIFEGWEEDPWSAETEEVTTENEENGKVYMALNLMDHDILKLSVLADNLQSPVIGLAFHLKYEKEKLYFLKYEPGEFLEDGGDPFYMVQNNHENGKIIFGETLRRDDRFPIGGKEVVHFYFQTNGKSLWNDEVIKFEFERPVISSIDTVRQDISGTKWENLHSDENGINHWKQDNLETNILASSNGDSIKSEKIWGVVIGVVVLFLLVKKFILEKWLKNNHRKYERTARVRSE